MTRRIGITGSILAAAALLAVFVVALRTQGDDDANAAAPAATVQVAAHDVQDHGKSGDHRPISPAALDFHDAMRKLWEDHITWTRLFIVSAAADLPDADLTAARLLENQAHIGDAIKPFYGEEAGNQLTALLRDHILIAAEILDAARNGDSHATDAAIERWYGNAHDIAAFLVAANPKHWPLAEMEAMMVEHLDLTLEEAVARLAGDFAADIAAYEKVHSAILEMADMLSDGIIAQFPRQFR